MVQTDNQHPLLKVTILLIIIVDIYNLLVAVSLVSYTSTVMLDDDGLLRTMKICIDPLPSLIS